MTTNVIPQYVHATEFAGRFLENVGVLREQIIGAAQELIGHSEPVLEAEWEFYESVRRIACPWVHKHAGEWHGWTPYREPEAMFAKRAIVQEVLGRDTDLEVAFGVCAIASLGNAGALEEIYAEEYPGPDDYLSSRYEAFSGLAKAMVAISLGRQLQYMPETKRMDGSEIQRYRKLLNKSAAEKRNECFIEIHRAFLAYLGKTKPKSIRDGARKFYEGLPQEKQIYQSTQHAVRNLSEALYGKRGRRKE